MQSHDLATRSLPPPVGTLPPPVETTPGRHFFSTAPEDGDHLGASQFQQSPVEAPFRIEQVPIVDPPWRIESSVSTALRVLKGRESSRWTPLISEAESRLRQELGSYARLDDDWDGNGAKAPSQEAVRDAMTFLDRRPADIPLPYPEEGTEGDVGVYWDSSDAHVFAEVIFEGDRTCAYFAVHGVPGAVTEKCGTDDVDVGAPWPDDLLRILRIQDPG